MGLIHTQEGIGERKSWPGEIPVESLYTAGIAGMRFFTALRDEGRILGSRCKRCSTLTLLPRAFCERCLYPTDAYEEVRGEGQIKTFTLVRRDLDGDPVDPPKVLALIVFEGIEGGIIHRVREIQPGDVRIGLRVEAVLLPKGKRKGSILDVSHFRPIGSGSGG